MRSNTIYEKQSKEVGIFEKDLKYIYVNGKIRNKSDKQLDIVNGMESKINNSFLKNKYKNLLKEKLHFASCYGDILEKDDGLIVKIPFDNNMQYIFKLRVKGLNIESSSVFKSDNGILLSSMNAFKEKNLEYINYEEKVINTRNLKSVENLNLYECYDGNEQIFGNYKRENLTYKNKNKGILEREESSLLKDRGKIYKKKSNGVKNVDVKTYKKDDFSYDNNYFYVIDNGVYEMLSKDSYLDAMNSIKSRSKVKGKR